MKSIRRWVMVGIVGCLGWYGVGCKRNPGKPDANALPVEKKCNQAVPSAGKSVSTDLPLGIVGAIEVIYLDGFKAPFEARIDTGATTSSIDARNIEPFERDGRRWVRFEVVNPLSGEVRAYELPVVRRLRIKRHGAPSLRRLAVMMTFRFGHLTLEREFSLIDRSNFRYPVLLGRNVIGGLAAVDPSRHNTL